MYLAICDKKINEKQKETEKLNDKIIDEYNNFPFWRKWFYTEDVRQQVIDNWESCWRWTKERIKEQREKDMVMFEKSVNLFINKPKCP